MQERNQKTLSITMPISVKQFTSRLSQLSAQAGATRQDPKAWMRFMEYAEAHLPLLAGAGRPKQADIDASLIGQAGCKNWQQFLEEKVGMKWSAWIAWRKAWLIVKEYPWMKQADISSSQVNTLKKNDAIPSTLKEWQSLQSEKEKLKVERHDNQLKTLKGEVAESATQISELKGGNRELHLVIQEMEKKNDRLTSLLAKANHLKSTAQIAKEAAVQEAIKKEKQVIRARADLTKLKGKFNKHKHQSRKVILAQYWHVGIAIGVAGAALALLINMWIG